MGVSEPAPTCHGSGGACCTTTGSSASDRKQRSQSDARSCLVWAKTRNLFVSSVILHACRAAAARATDATHDRTTARPHDRTTVKRLLVRTGGSHQHKINT
eukprot:3288816-Prymnesium_polylepis.1